MMSPHERLLLMIANLRSGDEFHMSDDDLEALVDIDAMLTNSRARLERAEAEAEAAFRAWNTTLILAKQAEAERDKAQSWIREHWWDGVGDGKYWCNECGAGADIGHTSTVHAPDCYVATLEEKHDEA